MKVQAKVSDEDLEILRKQSEYWITKLGLFDWDWRVMVLNKEGANGHAVLIPTTRKAIICVCDDREKIVTLEEIAKHECLEILLADIGSLMKSFYSDDVVDDEIHKVINRLMVVLK